MAVGEKPAKDLWDKLDVLGKLGSGIVLALLALFVKLGADNIATSLQTGDLVKSLIADLTTKNERTRQDIALIALNHSVGDRSPALVTEIAERIYRDILATEPTAISPEQESFGTVAFKVLVQRNATRAKEIREELESSTLTATLRRDLRSSANVAEHPQEEVPPQAQLVAKAFPSLIYIQFHSESEKPIAEGLRDRLREANFYAPGVELVNQNYPNEVRFFHREDKKLAQEVMTLTQDFLKKQESPRTFRTQDLSASSFSARAQKGQVEIWINLDRS